MAHESFEDAATGEKINAAFVAVKVDREEHPDVDAVYMAATQAMTGQGGWPMTVFATPDGQPFLCGTYYPRQQFEQLLDAVSQAWRTQREDVVRQGQAVVEAIASPGVFAAGAITERIVRDGATRLVAAHDTAYGGFGHGGPKFPPHLAMLFLLRHYQRTRDKAVLEAVQHTAEAMARGGIYDQVDGGFHRYAVDGRWVVPHFEKMLYDNALLLRVYTMLWRLTGDALAERVAHETYAFLVNHMATPEGGFASAFDADTAGVEGLTYVWTPAQLRELLEADANTAAAMFHVTAEGTFEHGASTLQLLADPENPQQYEDIRGRMLAARTTRPQPARDDKVVTGWNGLAIAALAEAGVLLDASYLDAARRCAELVLRVHVVA